MCLKCAFSWDNKSDAGAIVWAFVFVWCHFYCVRVNHQMVFGVKCTQQCWLLFLGTKSQHDTVAHTHTHACTHKITQQPRKKRNVSLCNWMRAANCYITSKHTHAPHDYFHKQQQQRVNEATERERKKWRHVSSGYEYGKNPLYMWHCDIKDYISITYASRTHAISSHKEK